MASSGLLSEDQFLCSICLGVFVQPVSTPCGHNFCMSCLTSYWKWRAASQCPLCKETFKRRPDLKVNTFISELVAHFKSCQATEAQRRSVDAQQGAGAVPCDVCTDSRQDAVKSCVECQTSYCGVHLEPHHRAAGLRRHKLVKPLASLEDKICREHNRLLTLFCREDESLLCDICAVSRHRDHGVVPVTQAHREMAVRLQGAEVQVQEMIQARTEKVQDVRKSVAQSKRDTKDAAAQCQQDLAALVSRFQRSGAALLRLMEEKQKAREERAEDFVAPLEREVTKLQDTAAKLRDLKETDDHLRLLRTFPTLPLPSQPAAAAAASVLSMDCSGENQRILKAVRSLAPELQRLLDKMSAEINKPPEDGGATLRSLQRYEVDVLLDPDTAHPLLVLSDDGRQVRYRYSLEWQSESCNPGRFTEHLAVLGRRGFSSGRSYFEVFVGKKTEWCLGVATASIERRGALIHGPGCGVWAMNFLKDQFSPFSSPNVSVHFGRVERVGTFVDFTRGEISFYDADTGDLIYSFTELLFTEELFPYFNPCDNEYQSNLDPMIVVPVRHAP